MKNGHVNVIADLQYTDVKLGFGKVWGDSETFTYFASLDDLQLLEIPPTLVFVY